MISEVYVNNISMNIASPATSITLADNADDDTIGC